MTSSPWRRALAQLAGTVQEPPVTPHSREGYSAGRRALAGLLGVRLTERPRRESFSPVTQATAAEAPETARASSAASAGRQTPLEAVDPKPVRPPAIVKLTLAIGGTGGVAGAVGLTLTRHVPFSPETGVFEDIVAVIALIALIAVALIALTVSLDLVVARTHLRYRAGKSAVDNAESNDQALHTYRMLDRPRPRPRPGTGSGRCLGPPDDPGEAG